MEEFSVEQMNYMKTGGTKLDGLKENLDELSVDLWSSLSVDNYEGEPWMNINSVRGGEGSWAYIKQHQCFRKTTSAGTDEQHIEDHATNRSEARP